MALDPTGETAALGRADHVDSLTGGKNADADDLPEFIALVGADAELSEGGAPSETGPGQVALLTLGELPPGTEPKPTCMAE